MTLVRVYWDNNGAIKQEETKATLLANNNNGPVWKIGNDIVTGLYGQSYRFPEVPPNLYDRPTLLMSLENSGSQRQQVETFVSGKGFVLECGLRADGDAR